MMHNEALNRTAGTAAALTRQGGFAQPVSFSVIHHVITNLVQKQKQERTHGKGKQ